MTRVSFKVQMLRAREDAIVAAVNRLLAERGFDAMTVDAVAAEVGIAKASLYKHFESKEALAGAAMIGAVDRALAEIERLSHDPAHGTDFERLKALTRWAMREQLAGEMPSLPPQSSALCAALKANQAYVERLMQLSDLVGAWIVAAQRAGQLDAKLPSDVVLYTLYARACDPVVALLKSGGNYDDEQIVELLLQACFGGIAARGA